MGFVLGDLLMGGTPDYASQAQAAEDKRQAAITQGTKSINRAFAGFGPGFYKQREQAYIDYALPQLADQYRQNSAQVGFGLANKGISNSSVANKAWSDLFRANQTGKQNIVDTAIGQAQDLKRQVASSKDQLLNQLYQSADPAGASRGAVSTAASFAQPSVFGPLANQFSSIANQYYLSSLLNQRPIAGSVPAGSYGSTFAPIPSNSYN